MATPSVTGSFSTGENDPTSKALIAFAMHHHTEITNTLNRAWGELRLAPSAIGLLINEQGIQVFHRPRFWEVAASVQLETGAGIPGCVPLLIHCSTYACVAWLPVTFEEGKPS